MREEAGPARPAGVDRVARGHADGAVIDVVGVSRLLFERTRASLRGGPFSVTSSEGMLPPGQADLYVIPAESAADGVGRAAGVPVIAFGPASLLRASFLAGCVDYLREPWEPSELEARAHAAIEQAAARRAAAGAAVRVQGLSLVGPRRTVALTAREARLLGLLLRSTGPVPRAALFIAGWGRQLPRESRTLDVHISLVRKKLHAASPPGQGLVIRAVRAEGYACSPAALSSRPLRASAPEASARARLRPGRHPPGKT